MWHFAGWQPFCRRAEIENFYGKDKRLKKTFTNIKILLYIFLKAWKEDTTSLEVTTMNQIEVATKSKLANDLKLWQGSVYSCENSPQVWRAVSWEGLPAPPLLEGGARPRARSTRPKISFTSRFALLIMIVLSARVSGFALRTTNHPVLQAALVRVKSPFQILLAYCGRHRLKYLLYISQETLSTRYRLGIVSVPYFSALEGWTATSLGFEFSLRGHG